MDYSTMTHAQNGLMRLRMISRMSKLTNYKAQQDDDKSPKWTKRLRMFKMMNKLHTLKYNQTDRRMIIYVWKMEYETEYRKNDDTSKDGLNLIQICILCAYVLTMRGWN